MLRLTVEIEGRSAHDLDLALDAVGYALRGGNTSGFCNSSDGSYRFDVDGEDDYARLEDAGFEYDGEQWERDSKTHSYDEALALLEEEA